MASFLSTLMSLMGLSISPWRSYEHLDRAKICLAADVERRMMINTRAITPRSPRDVPPLPPPGGNNVPPCSILLHGSQVLQPQPSTMCSFFHLIGSSHIYLLIGSLLSIPTINLPHLRVSSCTSKKQSTTWSQQHNKNASSRIHFLTHQE